MTRFLIEMETARKQIESKEGSIRAELVQKALVERLGLESELFLPEQDLSASQMVSALEGYNFPQILECVSSDQRFLPEDLPLRLDEERVRSKGEIWEIHKGEGDHWPSDPHAHNVESGYKLNFQTGDVHDPRKKRVDSWVYKLPRKDLVALRKLFKHPLPDLAV